MYDWLEFDKRLITQNVCAPLRPILVAISSPNRRTEHFHVGDSQSLLPARRG